MTTRTKRKIAGEALEQLRNKLDETGVRFLSIDDHHIQLEVHGHAHQPVSAKQLGEILGEIRHAWLR
jgi:dihydroxyacetone kinase-like predicted kinase